MWRIEYFELVAQMGPVVLLAYIVEGRSHGAKKPSTFVHRVRLAGIGCTLLPEIKSLGVVAGVADPTPDAGLDVAAYMFAWGRHS